MVERYFTKQSHVSHTPFIIRMLYRYLYDAQTSHNDDISLHRLCRNYFLKREKKPIMTKQQEYFEHMEPNDSVPMLL